MRVNTRVIWLGILFVFYLLLQQAAFQNFGKIFGINAVICLAASFAVITVFMYFAAPKNDVVLISAGSVLRPGLFMLVCGAAAVLGFMAQMLADANLRWLAFFVFICALAAPVIGFIFYKREIEKPEIISADSVIHAESQRVYSVKEMVISAVSIMLSLLFFVISVIKFRAGAYNFSLVFLSLGILMLFPAGISAGTFKMGNKISKLDVGVVSVLFLLTLLLRLYKLGEIPPGVGMEELEALRGAIDLSPKLKNRMIYGTLFHPIMQFELLGFMGRTLGFTLTNLRLIDVFAGSFVVVFIYFSARELFGSITAALASFFYSFMYISIFFSRTMFFWICPVFFITGMFCFAILAFRRQKIWLFVLAGVMAGLSMYSYHSGKASIIMAALLFIVFLIHPSTRKQFLKSWQGLAVFTLSVVIVLMPLIFYLIKEPDLYLLRASGEGIRLPANWGDVGAVNRYFYDIFIHFAYVLSLYFTKTAGWGGYALPFSPIIDPVTTTAFFAGVGILFMTWKDVRSMAVLSMLFFSMMPGLLSSVPDGGAPSRMLVSLPFMAIVAGIAVYAIPAGLKFNDKNLKAVILAAIFIGIIPFVVFENCNKYYVRHANDPSLKFAYANTIKRVADNAAKFRDYKKVFSEQYSWRYGDHLQALLRQHGLKGDMSYLPAMLDLPVLYNSDGKNVLITMEGIYGPQTEAMLNFFPDAIVKKHWYQYFWMYEKGNTIKSCYWGEEADQALQVIHSKANDEPVNRSEPKIAFITLEIPYKNIETLYGFRTDFYTGAKKVKETVTRGEIVNDAGADRIELSGMLYNPLYDELKIIADGADSYRVYLDSAPLGAGKYKEGLYNFRMSINVRPGKTVNLMMVNAQNGAKEPFSPSRMLTRGAVNKVKVDYFDKSGHIFYSQNIPAINASYFFTKPAGVVYKAKEPDYKAVWNANVNISETGTYMARIDTHFRTALYVDGKLCFDNLKGPEQQEYIKLSKGIHSFRAECLFRSDVANFRLMIKKDTEKYYHTPSFLDYE